MIYINGRFLTQKLTGVQRYALEVTRELVKLRPQVRILAPRMNAEQIPAELRPYMQFCGRFRGHLWEQTELPRHCKGAVLLNLCNTAPLLHKRSIVTVHDLAFLYEPAWFSKAFALWYRLLIPRICQKALQIWTVSPFSMHSLQELLQIPKERIRVLPPGVVLPHLPAQPLERKPKQILTVGSLDPRKNLSRLIQAVLLLSDDVELLIVGSAAASFSQDLGLPAQLPSRIRFTGYLSDAQLSACYTESSVFAFVSLYEGFGMPPFEALAAGCKLVLSDIPPLRENFATLARFTPAEDVKLLAQALQEALADQNKPPSNEVQALLERFTWAKTAHKMHTELEALGI
jgi:glycosyltransferase involved in cell wall biosynthesis